MPALSAGTSSARPRRHPCSARSRRFMDRIEGRVGAAGETSVHLRSRNTKTTLRGAPDPCRRPLTAAVTFDVSERMTKAGKIILSVIVLAAGGASLSVAVGALTKKLSPWQVYACDFRLISAATCDLPMAAHTTRVSSSRQDADRERRLAYRERIVACEHQKTAKRRNGEPVSARKCWNESPAPLVSVSSR